MSYSLNSVIINPSSKSNPKNAVILCHGYGGDGNDISILANYWKNFLPDTLFVCPDAPEICKVNPAGYQWFDLMDQTDEETLSKSLIAENKLNKFIDEVSNKNKLSFNNIALVGFSQGCMIALQTALKKKDQIKCVIGYSGKILNIKHLNQNSLKFINNVKLESSMINSLKSEYYQFVRKGYFKMDKDSDKDNLVFNQIVNLRDSWKKHTK